MKLSKINMDLKIPIKVEDGFVFYLSGFKGNDVRGINNFVLEDTLTFQKMVRGTNCKLKFHFKGRVNFYEMFLNDYVELTQNYKMSEPIQGKWSFLKRGNSFGIVKIDEGM